MAEVFTNRRGTDLDLLTEGDKASYQSAVTAHGPGDARRFSAHVKFILIRNGSVIQLAPRGVTNIVGGNNVGKSRRD